MPASSSVWTVLWCPLRAARWSGVCRRVWLVMRLGLVLKWGYLDPWGNVKALYGGREGPQGQGRQTASWLPLKGPGSVSSWSSTETTSECPYCAAQ
ncbi:hypothetical protein EYF80_045457 [Liparis tanakae]|uniref:Uncharacterized protein n=1 Tax=Liparis tanakae TaxID=230148 RepID=A0A4Z2FU29_9TELE|nr:hypothetical protein EYF80_045457 [Liparis tanakae]